MVRWNSTEMVVVETTSKNPSYRYTEGGIFSFMDPVTYDKPFKSYEELIEIDRYLFDKASVIAYLRKKAYSNNA